jgi:hypothetical protein
VYASLIIMDKLSTFHLPRLVNLSIDLFPPLMEVQRNGFRGLPFIGQGDLPAIRDISLHKSIPLWTWANSFQSITTIRLNDIHSADSPTIEELHAFLRSTPNVVALHLSLVECSALGSKPLVPLILLHLTHLQVAIISNPCSLLLSSLQLPLLKNITLDIWDEDEIAYFVERCGPLLATVTTAVVSLPLATFHQLAALLQTMPRLARLDARGSMTYFVSALHGLSLYWDNLCTNLTSVALTGPIEDHLLDDILLYRNNTNFSPDLHIISAM